MLNALTIDVEEHFQVHNLEHAVGRDAWQAHQSRVEPNTRRILELLRQHGVKATFFILGWVAERHPQLVRDIAAEGHEIASHGYWHELIYRQTEEEFDADILRSLTALGCALGSSVRPSYPLVGYRAPAFSITNESLWALDVLRRHGMRYDSSIFPLVAHDRYGISGARRFVHALANGLIEAPVSTVRLFGKNWPVAGGGYFRLFPFLVTRWAIRRINREGHPAVVYLHPWEVDPGQPRVGSIAPLARFRHYVNLRLTLPRLERLLGEFEFGPMQAVFSGLLETDKMTEDR